MNPDEIYDEVNVVPDPELTDDDILDMMQHNEESSFIVMKVIEWAEERNLIEGASLAGQMLKLTEEMGELASGIARGNREVVEDSIGDMLVVLTILSAQVGMHPVTALYKAYREIKDRKGKMVNGVFVKESDLTVTEEVA